jgi:hypothetical protein
MGLKIERYLRIGAYLDRIAEVEACKGNGGVEDLFRIIILSEL